MVESIKENDTRIAILQELLTKDKENNELKLKLKDNELKYELKLKDKQIQTLTKEFLQQGGFLTARGVFERAVTYAFEAQQMKGAFNCAAVLDKLNKNPSAGKWSKIIFDAMRSCADKSVPKKNLRDVWEELSLPIHGAPWNGDAVRTSKSLSAAFFCVVSELCEQFDFKIRYV